MNAVAVNATSGAVAEIEARLCKITGAPNAYAAVRRLCMTVVKASDQKEPPYRIKPLLDVLGVAFEYETPNSGAAEASVSLRDSGLVLEVAKRNFQSRSGKSRRWRFSIAHEFAHIVLLRTLGGRIVELTYQDKASYRFVERLCDHGASHILLPRAELTGLLWRRGFSQRTVRHIMERFDTSEAAVLRAIHDLLPGGAIFTIRSFRRHDDEECEPRIAFCSTIYSREAISPWLPRGSTMKRHLTRKSACGNERITVALNEVQWELEGTSLPWLFGPSQPDMFLGARASADVERKNDCGVAIVCAQKGKFNGAVFRQTGK